LEGAGKKGIPKKTLECQEFMRKPYLFAKTAFTKTVSFLIHPVLHALICSCHRNLEAIRNPSRDLIQLVKKKGNGSI